jgi:copper transport protein
MLLLAYVGRNALGRYAARAAASPALSSVGAMAVDPQVATVRRLRWFPLMEAALGGVVLAVTSILVATTPGREAAAPARAAAAQPTARATLPAGGSSASVSFGFGGRVAITVERSVDGSATVTLHVTDTAGKVLDPSSIAASVALAAGDADTVPLALHKLGPAEYAAHEITLPPPGPWRITVTVRTATGTVGTGTATVGEG